MHEQIGGYPRIRKSKMFSIWPYRSFIINTNLPPEEAARLINMTLRYSAVQKETYYNTKTIYNGVASRTGFRIKRKKDVSATGFRRRDSFYFIEPEIIGTFYPGKNSMSVKVEMVLSKTAKISFPLLCAAIVVVLYFDREPGLIWGGLGFLILNYILMFFVFSQRAGIAEAFVRRIFRARAPLVPIPKEVPAQNIESKVQP